MKKIFINCLIIFTMLSTMCVFATEEILVDSEVGEEVAEDSEIIELENYEDYEALFSEQEQISDEEYKKAYDEQLKMLEEYYEEFKPEKLVKAKVIEAGTIEDVYEADYTGIIYKLKKQDVTAKIMEGEYEGEEVTVLYPLTADSFQNLKVTEVKKGDTIYVATALDEETKEVQAQIASVGFNLERKLGVVILAIVAVVLIIAFGKERGILSTLIATLIIAITLLICSEQIFIGTPIIILTLILSAIIVSMIVIQKLGLTKDALMTGIVSMISILITAVLTVAVDTLLRNNGATFDVMLIIENIVKRNIDFHHMFIGSIILILSAIVPYVTCNVWNKCKESEEKGFNKLLEISKDAMTGKIEMVTIILMTLLMPKLVYLYSYKYTANEIMNSDIIVTELIRLFMCIIGITLVVPTTIYTYMLQKNTKPEEKE